MVSTLQVPLIFMLLFHALLKKRSQLKEYLKPEEETPTGSVCKVSLLHGAGSEVRCPQHSFVVMMNDQHRQ